jgi:hypothetical protein
MGIIGVVLFAIAGFALTNGMPHFVAGLGGRVFRTPFGATGFFDDRDERPDGSRDARDGSRRAPDGSRGAADNV